MDKLIVGVGGFLAIIFIIWFFFGKAKLPFGKKIKAIKVEEKEGIQEIEIIVDGSYNPSTIETSKGKKVKLNFLRRDPSDCLEEVVIGDFGIRQKLALEKITSIEFTPEKSGEFDFSCGMGMFHGKIIVK